MKRILAFILFTLLAVGTIANPSVSAVTAADWKAGRIISDAIFTNQDDMTVRQIQDFLNSKVGTGTNGVPGQCDTNGTRISELGGGTRAQYGAAHDNPTPFTCLKDYYEVPKTSPGPSLPANNYGGKAIPNGAVSAAQLIWNAAHDNGINPKVLLVKLGTESAGPLTSDDWPFYSQYKYAMGAHCPDSGPGGSANCDPNYAGFSIQISEAAALLRYYLDNMQQPWWTYKKPFQTNSILWNVSQTGCGASNVYIETLATAALYTYTPYQPNRAALNNMYGTGDGCSSYGNRNFWRVYNDWFGSPLYGNLVRTVSNATVYIVSDNVKYPVNSMSMLSNFSALGPVSYSTDEYLASKTTGPAATPLIKATSSSTLYFTNSGIKLPFTSCTTAQHYALPCGSEITLTDSQAGLFANGPSMTRLYQTVSGIKYYISSGTKREVYDAQSLTEEGVTGDFVRLLDSGVAQLPVGAPVVRDDVIIKSQATKKAYFYEAGNIWYLPADMLSQSPFTGLPNQELSADSLATLSDQGTMTGFIKDSADNSYVLLKTGKAALTHPEDWVSSYILLDDGFVSSIPDSSDRINDMFVGSNNNSTIYMVIGGVKYYIAGWNDFLNLHSDKSSSFIRLPDTILGMITNGGALYAPGSLLKSSSSATVYVVTGLLKKAAVSSFDFTDDLDLGGLRVVSNADLALSITSTSNISSFVSCGGKDYIANKGLLYEIDAQAKTQYGYGAVAGNEWDSIGCSVLSISSHPLSDFTFVKVDGEKTIYVVQDGLKHPIGSLSKYQSLGGTSANTLLLSNRASQTISTGSVIN